MNILDLDELGTIGPLGSPFLFVVRPELGDEWLEGLVVHNRNSLDQSYVVVKTGPERAEALTDFFELIGKRKLGRKVRTLTRVNLPQDGPWWHSGHAVCPPVPVQLELL